MSNQMKVGVTLHSYVTDLKKGNLNVDQTLEHAATIVLTQKAHLLILAP